LKVQVYRFFSFTPTIYPRIKKTKKRNIKTV
jgi:hypothetical protein